jgi:copper(I)-binding protein
MISRKACFMRGLLAVASGSACSRHFSDAAVGAIRVEAADVRILPAHVGAFYAKIVNDTGAPERLTGVESPDVDDAQLHDVVNEGAITSMREAANGFVIPAHGILTLERGSRHVMLFGARPKDGSLPLTLRFERRDPLSVDAPVRSALEETR